MQGVPVLNVWLEQGGDAHVLQVNKRRIEKRRGRGGLSLTPGPPRAASDMSSLVCTGTSFLAANIGQHCTVQIETYAQVQPALMHRCTVPNLESASNDRRRCCRDARCSWTIWLCTSLSVKYFGATSLPSIHRMHPPPWSLWNIPPYVWRGWAVFHWLVSSCAADGPPLPSQGGMTAAWLYPPEPQYHNSGGDLDRYRTVAHYVLNKHVEEQQQKSELNLPHAKRPVIHTMLGSWLLMQMMRRSSHPDLLSADLK